MLIVFATCITQPEISKSDAVLADAFRARGFEVIGAPWNGELRPFVDADHVIIRTTWDYFDHYPAFCDWLDRLDKHNVRVHNTLDTLRWNIHKSYLFDLITAGAPVLPAVKVEPDVDSIQQAARSSGWSRVVLKCLVSGTARGLSLFDPESQNAITQALEVASPWSEFGLTIQPFMSEIQTGGEISMVYVDGTFSHAVRKTPKDNEFRIQSEFGGQYERMEPDASVKSAAKRCLDVASGFISEVPLYARVDGLIVDGAFKLMELELAEPELMFNLAPESADRMSRSSRFAR